MKKREITTSSVTTVEFSEIKKSSKWLVRIFGLIIVLVSLSIYIQFIPMLFVFTGAYIGMSKDAVIGNMDSVIWILTSVTFMILSLYIYISWLRYAWTRFVVKATPFNITLFRK